MSRHAGTVAKQPPAPPAPDAHPRRSGQPAAPAAAAVQPPPYLLAGIVVLGVLALYGVTLAPTTQFWDTSEYIAAARVLGIPHPPGNPLFTLIAHVWGDALFVIDHYARRINLFAATTSAGAAGCWFLVSERWMRRIVPAATPRRLAAVAAALVSATAFTVWNQSVVNEKVYTLSLLSVALVLWLIVRWDDQPAGEAHDHYLLMIVYLLALTSTNHLMGVLVGSVVVILLFPPLKGVVPGVERKDEWAQFLVCSTVIFLLLMAGLEKPEPMILAALLYAGALAYAVMTGNARFGVAALLVAAVGLSVYFFLPIRAAHFPPINEGEPTTWAALWDVYTRKQYGKPDLWQRQATLWAQVTMWWQYFTWQWGRDWAAGLQRGLGVIFLALGLLGAWRHWRADRRTALAMTVLMFTFTLALIFYLNFKYGYSQYPDRSWITNAMREVRERDYFYIGSFAMWGIWVGLGLATLMEFVRDMLRERLPDERRGWLAATPVLLLALIPLAGNRLTASRAGETIARDFAVDLLQSLEPYGILVTAGDNDTFPLWYAQEVEGVRRDVTVVNLSLANTDWYLRQMQRRPVEPFVPENAPAIYHGRPWPMPTGKLMSWSDQDLARLELYYLLQDSTTVHLGPLAVTLNPQWIGRQYLERADVAVLRIIEDQLGKRPIYFSRTVGLYADQFGFTGYLEGQGFARKLHPVVLAPSDSIALVPSLGFVNLPRTQALLFDVYHYDTAARARPRGWVDNPSEGILALYGVTYQTAAMALERVDSTLAARALAIADSVYRNTGTRFPGGN
jgi:hypothetical protein